jgi:hypothetical protein
VVDWTEGGETLIAKLSANNGLARIADGEPVDDVIGGRWAMSLDRAAGVTGLLATDDHGKVAYERRVLEVADSETEVVNKNKITRVRFKLAPAPEFRHLHGQPSPAVRSRNAIGYVKTRTLIHGDIPAEKQPEGRRAVIDGFTLTVSDDGIAHLIVPAGKQVVVIAADEPHPAHKA